jgi:hypothetical protein
LIAGASTYLGRGKKQEQLSLEEQEPLAASSSHAAFIHEVGYWSHFDDRCEFSTWPLPKVGTVGEWAPFAAAHGVLTLAGPNEGDLFLAWSERHGAYVRAGIVTALVQEPWFEDGQWCYDCLTLEGNATADGEEVKCRSYRARRRFSPTLGDRFIRWADLDPRKVVSDPTKAVEWDGGGPRLRRAA